MKWCSGWCCRLTGLGSSPNNFLCGGCMFSPCPTLFSSGYYSEDKPPGLLKILNRPVDIQPLCTVVLVPSSDLQGRLKQERQVKEPECGAVICVGKCNYFMITQNVWLLLQKSLSNKQNNSRSPGFYIKYVLILTIFSIEKLLLGNSNNSLACHKTVQNAYSLCNTSKYQ